MAAVGFFKCRSSCIAIFRTGVKINIFKILLVGRGSLYKKEYSVYALDNVENCG